MPQGQNIFSTACGVSPNRNDQTDDGGGTNKLAGGLGGGSLSVWSVLNHLQGLAA